MPPTPPTPPTRPTARRAATRPGAQTAAARRAAEAELGALLAAIAPDHARLVAAVRRALRRRLPGAHELVYEYADAVVISLSATGRGHEGALAIRAAGDGVRLYVSGGAALPDPERLLSGPGSRARWMPVETARTLSRPAVAALIEAAIALSPAPFAPGGRRAAGDAGTGSVTVRPTTAAKRRPAPRAPAHTSPRAKAPRAKAPPTPKRRGSGRPDDR